MKRYFLLLPLLLAVGCDSDSDNYPDTGGDRGKQEEMAQQTLSYAYFSKYQRGQYGAAWKGYLQAMTIYAENEKSIAPEIYLFASLMCLQKYHDKGTRSQRSRCKQFMAGDKQVVNINEKTQILTTSLAYLKVSLHYGQIKGVAELIRCHEAILADQTVSCPLSNETLLKPFFVRIRR